MIERITIDFKMDEERDREELRWITMGGGGGARVAINHKEHC